MVILSLFVYMVTLIIIFCVAMIGAMQAKEPDVVFLALLACVMLNVVVASSVYSSWINKE